MPITVSEIAERTRHGASNNRFIERLHYWTRERLLIPMGKRNPGTGKRRLYPDTAVQDALILNAMMEAGVSVEAQRLAIFRFREERRVAKGSIPSWLEQSGKSGGNVYLEIDLLPGNRPSVQFHEGDQFMAKGLAERATIFNLTRLLQNETGGTSG
jgi:DNA-binding transcriptional MerR regulator